MSGRAFGQPRLHLVLCGAVLLAECLAYVRCRSKPPAVHVSEASACCPALDVLQRQIAEYLASLLLRRLRATRAQFRQISARGRQAHVCGRCPYSAVSWQGCLGAVRWGATASWPGPPGVNTRTSDRRSNVATGLCIGLPAGAVQRSPGAVCAIHLTGPGHQPGLESRRTYAPPV